MPEGDKTQLIAEIREMIARGEVSVEQLAGGFSLQAQEVTGPRVTGSKVKYPRALAEYAKEWGIDERTLKRFVGLGRKCEPMDLPPFHQPEKLAAWYGRHHKNRVPDWILRMGPKVQTAPEAAAASAPVVVQAEVINLATAELAEGEAVQQARRLVAAAYEALERAYRNGGGNVDLLQSRYNKALEGLRKIEDSERQWLKKRGELVSRLAVERDIETAVEMLRQMRESMRRRVLELCPSLSAEQKEQVGAAVVRVCEQQERVFRNLESLKSPADVVHLLAA